MISARSCAGEREAPRLRALLPSGRTAGTPVGRRRRGQLWLRCFAWLLGPSAISSPADHHAFTWRSFLGRWRVASTMTKIALQLAIFVVAAVPGYLLAIARLDKIGHRRLQLLGFAMMALCFAVIAVVPGMTTMVVPFLLVYGVSYFFTEFGPNMTTFVMPSELYPVALRATGHGISAGVGKLGAFIGVFLFPVLSDSLGLRGTLLLTAGVAVLGFALTLVLPEPAGRSLEDMPASTRDTGAQPLRVTDQASAH
jgi:MFS family permease